MRKDAKQRAPANAIITNRQEGQEQSAPPVTDLNATNRHHAPLAPGAETSSTVAGEGSSTYQSPHRGYAEDLLSHTPSVVIAVDEQFTIYDLNPSAQKKLGFAFAEARDRPCKEVLMCRNLNGTQLCGTSKCPLAYVLEKGETISSHELFLGARPQFSAEYSVNVNPGKIGSRSGAVFAGRDLSAVKVANQVRANFVSMVSHELRTPLNSVHGFIDLLMQGHMGALTEEQKKYLGYSQEGVQQLMTIVEDILFMTRSDSGQFEIKPQKVNSRVVAKQVVNSLKLQALKAAVILNKDIPAAAPLLYADPQRVQQVLNNLVVNAIKFTPPNGTVTIRVRAHPEQDRMVLFAVIDDGDGIPPEDQPHIFERFYQSNHAMQSKMGGYGLGLSIARLIVEQHGGTIFFESTPQRGTTFYFTVPLYRGQDEEQT